MKVMTFFALVVFHTDAKKYQKWEHVLDIVIQSLNLISDEDTTNVSNNLSLSTCVYQIGVIGYRFKNVPCALF